MILLGAMELRDSEFQEIVRKLNFPSIFFSFLLKLHIYLELLDE